MINPEIKDNILTTNNLNITNMTETQEQTKAKRQEILSSAYSYLRRAEFKVLKTNNQTFKLMTQTGLKIIRAAINAPRKEPDMFNGVALQSLPNEIEIWLNDVIIELYTDGDYRIIDRNQMNNMIYVDEYRNIKRNGQTDHMIIYVPDYKAKEIIKLTN